MRKKPRLHHVEAHTPKAIKLRAVDPPIVFPRFQGTVRLLAFGWGTWEGTSSFMSWAQSQMVRSRLTVTKFQS